ncbi:protein LYK5-like [Durio zibethinus]|uniref:Protein LYK5-like n=1 Tax=Durio zibethinus TaxID=66656 RepID=A0A6P6AVE1_DURZI|nr:protein LYK5-like [Durio zibethinus]
MIFFNAFTMNQFLFCFFILINIFTLYINAQQNYSGNSALDCDNNDESGLSSAFLYTCNGQDRFCQAFLIYKSQPSFNSVPSISVLTSSNQAEIASINNVTEYAKFPTGKEVIVPVNCFCLGQNYQANTTFHISSFHGTYYTIGTEAYQGLSTCSSLKRANPQSQHKLVPGIELKVPLRCACPTSNQTKSGIKYLLTYSISSEDNIPDISDRFNVSRKSINDANGLEEKQTIFPSTTILIPLPSLPSSSQTMIHKDQPLDLPPFEEYHKSNRSKRKLYEGVGIAAACSLLLLIIILFTVFMFNKRKDGVLRSSNERKKNYVLPEDLRAEIASLDQGLRVFTYEEIKKATQNFSSKNRIKGSVYRGDFGGKILAVKRMRRDVSKEVQLLKSIYHFNLIKLQGVCENYGCYYLVFEYMKKGSLRDWLFNQSPDEIGSWKRRIQIALDVANGLHYLHSFTKPAYIHGDIKSSNVLLNSGLRAKIANFSLARAVVNETSSDALTTRVLATRGYMAPEYVETGQVTSKIDVYAFGVVLLELITGKDAIITQDRRQILLSAAIVSIMEKENAEAELDSFIDPRLKCDDQTEFALRMAQLSVACLTEEPTKRPSMEEVVSVLSKIRADVLK